MRALWCWLLAAGCAEYADAPPQSPIVRPIGTENTPWRAGPAGTLLFEVQAAGDALQIHTHYQRFCTRDSFRTRDISSPGKRADEADTRVHDVFGTPGGNNPLMVTFAITAAVVITYTPTLVTEKTMEFRACPLEAPGLHFEVRLPSGAMTQLTTDASALALVPIDGEPPTGQLTLWGNGPAHQIRYDRGVAGPIVTPDPCRALRSFAMLTAARIENVKERTRVLLALPVCEPLAH